MTIWNSWPNGQNQHKLADDINDFKERLTSESAIKAHTFVGHFKGFSSLQTFDTLLTEFQLAQNLSSYSIEWSCAVVTTNTTRCEIKEIYFCALEDFLSHLDLY